MKLAIQEASLVYRFYRSDGWTRSEVSEYVVCPDGDKAIHYVIPRYFNSADDDEIEEECNYTQELQNDRHYPMCDYYAVYDMRAVLDMKRLKEEHVVIPFGKIGDW